MIRLNSSSSGMVELGSSEQTEQMKSTLSYRGYHYPVVFKNSISLVRWRSLTSLRSDSLRACAPLWTHFNLW